MSDRNNPGKFLIDPMGLLNELWQKKIKILVIMSISSIFIVLFALSLEDIYKSEVIVSEVESSSNNSILNMSEGLGLAAIAGFSLQEDITKSQLALRTIRTRDFILEFLEKYQLKPELFATKSWNKYNNSFEYDESIYDIKKEEWLLGEDLESQEPTNTDAYNGFLELLSIEKDSEQGFYIISFSSLSPNLSKEIVDKLIYEINKKVQKEDVFKYEKSIDFINEKLKGTKLASIESSFFSIIEQQTKQLMLASVDEEYALKVIDPAYIPDKKSGPPRAIICVSLFLLVFIFTSGYFIMGRYLKKLKMAN